MAFAEDTKLLRPENLELKGLQSGFLYDADLYPNGSVQGEMPKSYKLPINGGDAVIDVPINTLGHNDPVIMDLPDFLEPDSDDEI